MTGYFKLWRKITDSQVFQNEGLLKVWIWCLAKATYKERWVSVKTGRGETEVKLQPGQFIFGRKSAAKKLKMKPSTIWKRIQKLKKCQNLNIESNTKYSIVTICNWKQYQMIENEEVTSKVTTKEQPSNNQGTQTRRYKKVKEYRGGKKATQLPPNFNLSEKRKSYAKKKGLHNGKAEYEFQKFCNHWQATGKTFKDWDAVWRNWVLKAVEWQKPNDDPPDAGREWDKAMEQGKQFEKQLMGG